MKNRARIRPRERRVYDEAGERIIRELPPGIYHVLGWPNKMVRIDGHHRARIYSYVPGGARGTAHPYRGYIGQLLRTAFERLCADYIGWPIPALHESTNSFEAAWDITPWAYEAMERRSGAYPYTDPGEEKSNWGEEASMTRRQHSSTRYLPVEDDRGIYRIPPAGGGYAALRQADFEAEYDLSTVRFIEPLIRWGEWSSAISAELTGGSVPHTLFTTADPGRWD